jgi:hypothetical protein
MSSGSLSYVNYPVIEAGSILAQAIAGSDDNS